MIFCLIVFCFESIRDNLKTAIYQVQSGYKLLKNWLRTYLYPLVHSTITSHPNTCVVEVDHIQALSHIDLQILTIVNDKSLNDLIWDSKIGTVDIERMPATILTSSEAHLYWKLVIRRSAHFINAASRLDQEYTWKQTNASFNGSDRIDVSNGTIFHRSYLSDPIPWRDQGEYTKYADKVSLWMTAFRPFQLFLTRQPEKE